MLLTAKNCLYFVYFHYILSLDTNFIIFCNRKICYYTFRIDVKKENHQKYYRVTFQTFHTENNAFDFVNNPL